MSLPGSPIPRTRDRLLRVAGLAGPPIAASYAFQLMGLVDSAMVGRLGTESLGAVGFGSFLMLLATTPASASLQLGVQARAARRLAEAGEPGAGAQLAAGVALAVALGGAWSFLLYLAVPAAIPLLIPDAETGALSSAYASVRTAGVPGVCLTAAFAGYWYGVGQPGVQLRVVVFMLVCNVVLDWLLIFGHAGFPRLGVEGAALASVISTYAAVVALVLVTRARRRPVGVSVRAGVGDARALLGAGLPGGFQRALGVGAAPVLLWIVAKAGPEALAAGAVLMQLSAAAIVPGSGFGTAAATLVANALGRDERAEARLWGWNAGTAALLVGSGLSAAVLAGPEALLGVFLVEPAARAIAFVPLVIGALVIPIDALGSAVFGALIGAGSSVRAAITSFGLHWLVALPLSWLLVESGGHGLLAVWLSFLGARTSQAVAFAAYWRGDSRTGGSQARGL